MSLNPFSARGPEVELMYLLHMRRHYLTKVAENGVASLGLGPIGQRVRCIQI